MKNCLFFLLLFLSFSAFGQEIKEKLTSSETIADIDFLTKTIQAVHPKPYLHISEEEFETEQKALIQKYKKAENIKLKDFFLDLIAFFALLGDAHSQPYLSRSFFKLESDSAALFPLQLRYDPDLKAVFSEDKKLLKVNGQDATELYQNALAYQAGTFAFRQNYVSNYFFPVFLYLKGIYPPFEVEFKGKVAKTFNPISYLEIYDRISPHVNPYSFKILENEVGYLQCNACQDYRAFKTFLKKTFKELEDKEIAHLIIDIRYNFGGDSGLNDLLLPYISQKPYRQSAGRHWKVSQAMKDRMDDKLYRRAFGKRFIAQYRRAQNGSFLKEDEYPLMKPKHPKDFFEGKVAVLIGPQTFSSANFLADAIKTYELATLIGQPTGELTNDFGEQLSFELPNSGISFGLSSAYDIGADNDLDKVSPVQPDIFIEEDTLKYALDWIRSVRDD
ncbi:MAG: S41 family peptidase [Bacteroidota bacterium]